MSDRPNSTPYNTLNRGSGMQRGDRLLIFGLGLGLAIVYGFAAHSYYSDTVSLFDSSGHPIGRDFVNIWTASVLSLGGQAPEIFDAGSFHAHQEQLLGRSFPIHIWSYALWSVTTLTLCLSAALSGRWTSWSVAELLLAPATVINFVIGQNGYLTAALLIGGMRLIDSRPTLAGVLFGRLSFKPQLGLLIPARAKGCFQNQASAAVSLGTRP